MYFSPLEQVFLWLIFNWQLTAAVAVVTAIAIALWVWE